MAGFTSFLHREPVGVCAAVTPWNYPAMMAIWKWAPALAASNSIGAQAFRPTPASMVWMAELMAEFLLPGVLNVVCGDRDMVAALVRQPALQMVSITGGPLAENERGVDEGVYLPSMTETRPVHRLRRWAARSAGSLDWSER